jgi:DNA primase
VAARQGGLEAGKVIPQDFIQQLLGRVDIVDVIDRHVKLKKAGQNYSACCPFHNEKTPSFSVSPAKQFYHCFGCGAHGTAISFLMEYSGMGFVEAVKDLAESVGLAVPDDGRREKSAEEVQQALSLGEVLSSALTFYRRELKRNTQAIEYLKGRGLTGEIAVKFGIGYAPDDWQGLKSVFDDYSATALKEAGLVIDSDEGRRYDRFRDRVMFPILDARGNVIGFGGRVIGQGEPKYLNSPETPLFEKGRELYGLYQARRAIRDLNTVLVVEGYMDVVALAQNGVEHAVATLGTATTPMHVQKLLRMADNLVFCFDGDNAGRKAAWRALEVSLPVITDGKAVSFLFLPQEDDPDTYVRRLGKEAFLAEVKNAKPLSALLMDELANRVDLRGEEGKARLLSEARPLIAQIEAPALGLMIRKRLAELMEVTAEDLQQLMPGKSRPMPSAGRPAPPKDVRRKAPPRSTENKVLSFMLAKPQLAAHFDLDLPPNASPSLRTIDALAHYLRDCDFEVSHASILEHFRGREEGMAIAEAATAPIVAEEEFGRADFETEFRESLSKLKADLRKARRDELAARASQSSLSPEERQEYLELSRGSA